MVVSHLLDLRLLCFYLMSRCKRKTRSQRRKRLVLCERLNSELRNPKFRGLEQI